MKSTRFKALMAGALLLLSAGFFLLQYFLFHNSKEGFFLLLQDFTFLPISVVLVTLFLDKIISLREKQEKLNNLNILINDFFNEAGADIIREANRFVENIEEIRRHVHITQEWTQDDFNKAVASMERTEIQADARRFDLAALRDVLLKKKPSILAMVENPSLLEHNRFTDMLWAVYHLEEELRARDDFAALPPSDIGHLTVDLVRAYRLLCVEWLYFNHYIKQRYPYLFSLALRKSPFFENSVVVGG